MVALQSSGCPLGLVLLDIYGALIPARQTAISEPYPTRTVESAPYTSMTLNRPNQVRTYQDSCAAREFKPDAPRTNSAMTTTLARGRVRTYHSGFGRCKWLTLERAMRAQWQANDRSGVRQTARKADPGMGGGTLNIPSPLGVGCGKYGELPKYAPDRVHSDPHRCVWCRVQG